jgi:hypothetical protein
LRGRLVLHPAGILQSLLDTPLPASAKCYGNAPPPPRAYATPIPKNPPHACRFFQVCCAPCRGKTPSAMVHPVSRPNSAWHRRRPSCSCAIHAAPRAIRSVAVIELGDKLEFDRRLNLMNPVRMGEDLEILIACDSNQRHPARLGDADGERGRSGHRHQD